MNQPTIPATSSASGRTRRDFIRAAAGALLASATGCVSRPGSPASTNDQVITVRGPIPAGELGFTLPHEHVFVTAHADPKRNLSDPEAAVRELALYAAAGGRSVVDLTNIGIGRNPAALRLVSERTDLNIVMGTGLYKHKWLPPETHTRSVEELTAQFVREIEVGVDGTGIRAGILGEIGVSSTRQAQSTGRTATEERGLRAAARAQRITGAGINLHFDIRGSLPEHEEILNILAAEGADLKRVALSHFIPNAPQIPHFHRIAARGCFVAFDLFGLEKCMFMNLSPPDEEKFKVIRQLVAEGLSGHLLLSQDLCARACLVENGGFGYAHILRTILPRLEAIGVDRGAIRQMTIENPRRLLAIRKT